MAAGGAVSIPAPIMTPIERHLGSGTQEKKEGEKERQFPLPALVITSHFWIHVCPSCCVTPLLCPGSDVSGVHRVCARLCVHVCNPLTPCPCMFMSAGSELWTSCYSFEADLLSCQGCSSTQGPYATTHTHTHTYCCPWLRTSAATLSGAAVQCRFSEQKNKNKH